MPVYCEQITFSGGFFDDVGLAVFGDGEVCEMCAVAVGVVISEGTDAFGDCGADLVAAEEFDGDLAQRGVFCGP